MRAREIAGALAIVVAAGVGFGPEVVRGQRPPPSIHDVRLENPAALRRFYAALRTVEQGADRKVRVLHYGDSNVAADLWTRVTRDFLHERYGDGGPGYVVPGFGSRADPDLRVRQGPGWHSRRKGFAKDFGPLDGLWGLAGVAAEGRGRGAWIDLDMPPMPRGGVLEIHALGRPKGGDLEVRIDDGRPVPIPTEAPREGLVRRRFHLAPGGHEARVRVNDWRPARLLGVSVELAGRGVVYDVLGINGHRASALLEWNEDLWRAQLEQRRPDLVVLSYGGNEALDPQLGLDSYQEQLERVVSRVQRLMPNAGILLVGPIPMCPERPRVAQVAAVQRRVARRAAVAFWDSSRIAGDEPSLCSWRGRRPPLISGDGMHLSKEGYGEVGRRFTRALLAPLQRRHARR